ncbi:hypothetical protein H6G81_18830 [Scytonema hofmannii FACHB-248]|uniref:Rpn family recombination-promoting nuclease/putative transposase n=1 Tax=Scytonema hofmannii FACHB-248 TaxID=1842502 RepID=A0ABR8GST7_9CYAN|nr:MULTISPECIES: hypothetical protein [Nostocales]MBD2606527.1 hypothetical protein [Scytonema hofmannii FACHB-248]
MFDNVCKFLAENFSTDFASWLLGEPITLTELSPLIKRVLRREIMRESVIYQHIWEEAQAEGEAKGRAEGVQEGVRLVAVNLLNRGMAVEEVARVTGLSLQKVELLLSSEGEA